MCPNIVCVPNCLVSYHLYSLGNIRVLLLTSLLVHYTFPAMEPLLHSDVHFFNLFFPPHLTVFSFFVVSSLPRRRVCRANTLKGLRASLVSRAPGKRSLHSRWNFTRPRRRTLTNGSDVKDVFLWCRCRLVLHQPLVHLCSDKVCPFERCNLSLYINCYIGQPFKCRFGVVYRITRKLKICFIGVGRLLSNVQTAIWGNWGWQEREPRVGKGWVGKRCAPVIFA